MSDTRKALLVVAAHAKNADDCRELLDMLGITPPKPKRRHGRPRVDHGHGDHRTYQNGCRCDDCRDAMRLRAAEQRAKRKANPSGADRAGHGKAATYRNHGCRCAECTTAHTADCTAYKARRRERAALAATGGAR